jgi:hypothetical protein
VRGSGKDVTTMLLRLCSLVFVVNAVTPQSQSTALWLRQNVLTPLEKSQLEVEDKIENRIRTYGLASLRFHKLIEGAVLREDLQNLGESFECWSDLLSSSLKDIEKSVERKKKSKALIRYEIQLRKSISDITELKLKVTLEEQKQFDAWLEQAEEIRRKFVDILFQRDSRNKYGKSILYVFDGLPAGMFPTSGKGVFDSD